ncbi:MlaA family lipoprotein [Algiphilus aromaticivorans]|jgi:phospholipid-binding lipoprotein MlaA|uniref:MlaA family lipoprotein n=1 Tax=Algiphilus aromaticivorans TaxID=382454 RepID=UPI0005C26512|nr:VacJ family lipoprotein [Algiphilus aromaticivorans]
MLRRQLAHGAVAALTTGLLAACAHTPAYDPADPLEPLNRGIYSFNRTADRYVLRPVARGYKNVTPQPVRSGIGNFLSNLSYPVTILNAALQGKFAQAGRDTGRFLINSTAGLVGFIDVATPVGLRENDEDFGQTLGHWGVGPGWYLMVPFLGPSTNRDILGRGADSFSTPERLLNNEVQYVITGFRVIDLRARLLSADGFLEGQVDEYVALRTVYLESRLNLVYDGNPPIDYGEEPLEEGEDSDADDDWRDDW